MEKITVLEKGQKLEFSFEDLLKYHGVGYPGGVAHAFQVMQRAFPQLDDGKLLDAAGSCCYYCDLLADVKARGRGRQRAHGFTGLPLLHHPAL